MPLFAIVSVYAECKVVRHIQLSFSTVLGLNIIIILNLTVSTSEVLMNLFVSACYIFHRKNSIFFSLCTLSFVDHIQILWVYMWSTKIHHTTHQPLTQQRLIIRPTHCVDFVLSRALWCIIVLPPSTFREDGDTYTHTYW